MSRWLLVTQDLPPGFTGGVAAWAHDLALALHKGGENVVVMGRSTGDTRRWDQSQPFEVVRMHGRSWGRWQGAWAGLHSIGRPARPAVHAGARGQPPGDPAVAIEHPDPATRGQGQAFAIRPRRGIGRAVRQIGQLMLLEINVMAEVIQLGVAVDPLRGAVPRDHQRQRCQPTGHGMSVSNHRPPLEGSVRAPRQCRRYALWAMRWRESPPGSARHALAIAVE